MDCKQCGSESHCGDCRVGLWGKLELREHDISAAISDRIARSWTLLDFTEIRLGGKNFEVLLLSSFDRGEIQMGKIWKGWHFGGNSNQEFGFLLKCVSAMISSPSAWTTVKSRTASSGRLFQRGFIFLLAANLGSSN